MIKEAATQKLLFLMSISGGVLLHININEVVNFIATYISIISFIVILVSNWYKFSTQIKYWIRKVKSK
jgi:hypothetical protein